MKKITKAVIPVAGMGTRFLPITKSIPKEMLPIVDKPNLQYIIEEAVESGIEEVLLIINKNKTCIKDYFNPNYELESRLEANGKIEELKLVKKVSNLTKIFYINQEEPKGSGDAISLAKEFVSNEPFAIMYGDDLIKSEVPGLKQLINMYEKYDTNVIGVKNVSDDLVSNYGIVDYLNEKTGEIKGLVEKPNISEAPSNSAILGRYIIKPEIFDELSKIKEVNGEYLFTDAMLLLMKKQSFHACNIIGNYYDIGSKLGYVKANIDFALDIPKLRKDLINYIK